MNYFPQWRADALMTWFESLQMRPMSAPFLSKLKELLIPLSDDDFRSVMGELDVSMERPVNIVAHIVKMVIRVEERAKLVKARYESAQREMEYDAEMEREKDPAYVWAALETWARDGKTDASKARAKRIMLAWEHREKTGTKCPTEKRQPFVGACLNDLMTRCRLWTAPEKFESAPTAREGEK